MAPTVEITPEVREARAVAAGKVILAARALVRTLSSSDAEPYGLATLIARLREYDEQQQSGQETP